MAFSLENSGWQLFAEEALRLIIWKAAVPTLEMGEPPGGIREHTARVEINEDGGPYQLGPTASAFLEQGSEMIATMMSREGCGFAARFLSMARPSIDLGTGFASWYAELPDAGWARSPRLRVSSYDNAIRQTRVLEMTVRYEWQQQPIAFNKNAFAFLIPNDPPDYSALLRAQSERKDGPTTVSNNPSSFDPTGRGPRVDVLFGIGSPDPKRAVRVLSEPPAPETPAQLSFAPVKRRIILLD